MTEHQQANGDRGNVVRSDGVTDTPGTGESGGGARAGKEGHGDGGEAGSAGHGGQSSIGYHGPGQLGDEAVGDKPPNAPAR